MSAKRTPQTSPPDEVPRTTTRLVRRPTMVLEVGDLLEAVSPLLSASSLLAEDPACPPAPLRAPRPVVSGSIEVASPATVSGPIEVASPMTARGSMEVAPAEVDAPFQGVSTLITARHCSRARLLLSAGFAIVGIAVAAAALL